MNKEIEEILKYLKDKDDYIEDFGISYKRIHIDNGDLKMLLDYITNLQEVNEKLRNGLETARFIVKVKQETIDSLTKYITGSDK